MSFYKFAALSRPSLFSLKVRLCSSMASDRVFTNSRGVKCVLPRLPPSISKVFTPGQMYRHQESVKKLPVMPLDYILGKYLETVEVYIASVSVSLFVDCLRICGCFSLVRACYYQDCIIFTICTLTVTFCSILALKASTCNIVLPRVHIYLILFKSRTGLWFEAL